MVHVVMASHKHAATHCVRDLTRSPVSGKGLKAMRENVRPLLRNWGCRS